MRHWYITIFGVLLTAGLIVGAVVAVPATYEAKASVLLIPPKTGQQVNPYLGLGGLQEVSDVLSRAVSDTATANQIIAEGGAGTYAVGRDTSTSGPIILITTQARTAPQALDTNQKLIDKLGPTLRSLQDQQHVPTASLITLITLTNDPKASAQRKSQLRSIIGAAALGLLLLVLLVAQAERRRLRRRRATVSPTNEVTVEEIVASTAGAEPAPSLADAVAEPATRDGEHRVHAADSPLRRATKAEQPARSRTHG